MHHNGENSFLFLNGTEIIWFKAKDSKIATYPLCLGNISKNCVYGFSVDYDVIGVSDILDIHKYLMKKKWHSIKCLGLSKSVFL